jgi:AcrR family transcriptional regulator
VARQRLRRDESQAQTREALLHAAGELFDAKGFGATSIADIAEQAGYTTGAVYSNFASKDDLFLAVLERQVVAEMRALQEALSAETTIDARLAVVGRWYASQAGQGRRRTRVLAELALLSGRPSGAPGRLHEQRKLLHQAIAALLHQQEIELGIEFRLPLPTLATAVQALLEGFALSSAIDDDVDTAALVAALEMLLRPHPPPP